MLQRAASNAYTWWWASHIRTKQSKWLENNLQDMEVMITSMLKIIEEDADTFAKRAEMYYRKRPELTELVRETYKAHRALAERYDHLSGALQKANNTIATVFPDQHLVMEDEDDDSSTAATAANVPPPHLSPCESARALREENKMKKKKKKKVREKRSSARYVGEAEEEIDRLQKDILILQTEKEFIKSSYECGIAKFWEKHKMITDMQERLGKLQDEFGDDVAIEDDEARASMAVTAVKSCVETLVNVYERRIKCMEEARAESQRIKRARAKLGAMRKESGLPQFEKLDDPSYEAPARLVTDGSLEEEELSILKRQKLALESMCEKVRKSFKMDPNTSILDIAEEIDEHVSKVATLETTTSSQIAQVEMLRLEVDELHECLQSLEGENLNLIRDSRALSDKLKLAEEELRRAEDLNKVVQDESCNLQEQFNEARNGLNVLADRLHLKDDTNEMAITGLTSGSNGMVVEEEESTKEACETKDLAVYCTNKDIDIGTNQNLHGATEEGFQDHNSERNEVIETLASPQQDHESRVEMERQESKNNEEEFRLATNAPQQVQDAHARYDQISKHEDEDEDEDEDGAGGGDGDGDVSLMNWQEMLLADLEDREKVILAEYTSILQGYKELKKKVIESDRKYQDNLFETTTKMRDLKNSIIMKDEEIRSLKQQLQFLAASWAENSDVRMAEPEVQDFAIGRSGKISRSSSIISMNYDAPASELSLEQEMNQVVTNGEAHIFKTADRLSSKSITVHLVETDGATTPIEGKFRRDIDQLLEDNLGFWLRFESSFEQMQKYREEFQELEAEITKLVDEKEESASSSGEHPLKDCATKVHRKLKDLQSDMSASIQENGHMNEELHNRFSSLSNIEEEILRVAKEGGEGGIHFTAYQALKFQGEVVNMRQENNHVAGELHAGMDHMRSLQAKVHVLIEKLDTRFQLSTPKRTIGNDYGRTSSKLKVPLSAFLFGTRRRKHSIFACMNPFIPETIQ